MHEGCGTGEQRYQVGVVDEAGEADPFAEPVGVDGRPHPGAAVAIGAGEHQRHPPERRGGAAEGLDHHRGVLPRRHHAEREQVAAPLQPVASTDRVELRPLHRAPERVVHAVVDRVHPVPGHVEVAHHQIGHVARHADNVGAAAQVAEHGPELQPVAGTEPLRVQQRHEVVDRHHRRCP